MATPGGGRLIPWQTCIELMRAHQQLLWPATRFVCEKPALPEMRESEYTSLRSRQSELEDQTSIGM